MGLGGGRRSPTRQKSRRECVWRAAPVPSAPTVTTWSCVLRGRARSPGPAAVPARGLGGPCGWPCRTKEGAGFCPGTHGSTRRGYSAQIPEVTQS